MEPTENSSGKRHRTMSVGELQASKEQVAKRRNSETTPAPVELVGQEPLVEEEIDLQSLSEEGFVIKKQFEVQEKIGAGSFGQVLKVTDLVRNELVALKVSKRDGDCLIESRKEADILEFLNKLDEEDKFHIVKKLGSFYWKERHFLVIELLPLSLWQLLYHRNRGGMTINSTKTIMLQLVEALDFLALHGIIHRDIKPNNIMVKCAETLEVKLIDFGSAEFRHRAAHEGYFQTRYYRAPEVMVGLRLMPAMDMWSLGCIMVELYIGRPLFPGECQKDQVNKILEVVGMPSGYLLAKGQYSSNYFTRVTIVGYKNNVPCYARLAVFGKDYGVPGSNQLNKIVKKTKPGEDSPLSHYENLMINLATKMLLFDPTKRVLPAKALSHPFFRIVPGINDQSEINPKSAGNQGEKPSSSLN